MQRPRKSWRSFWNRTRLRESWPSLSIPVWKDNGVKSYWRSACPASNADRHAEGRQWCAYADPVFFFMCKGSRYLELSPYYTAVSPFMRMIMMVRSNMWYYAMINCTMKIIMVVKDNAKVHQRAVTLWLLRDVYRWQIRVRRFVYNLRLG